MGFTMLKSGILVSDIDEPMSLWPLMMVLVHGPQALRLVGETIVRDKVGANPQSSRHWIAD